MKKYLKWIASAAAMVIACAAFASPVSAGWVQSGSRWWYQNADGSYPQSEWSCIAQKWYLFDEEGYMLTGWQYTGGKWYYLNPNGDMAAGWKKVGNVWYYLDASGAMKTGWLTLNGSTYYLSQSGAMLTGTQTIGGKTYTFSADGALVQDTAADDRIVYWGKTGTKYHIDPNCRSFQGEAANSGTIEEAKAAGRTGWCGICSKGWTDDRLDENGNPYAK